jgi:hypothetical protein
MIDAELSLNPGGSIADRADVALEPVDGPVLVVREVVCVRDVLLMVVGFALVALDSMMRGTSWTRVRCRALATFFTI